MCGARRLLFAVLSLMACSGRGRPPIASTDSGSGDIQLAPSGNPQALNDRPPADRVLVPAPASLDPGTTIHANLRESINSRRDKAGKTVTARVASDVTDERGHVVIPAGSTVEMTVTELEPARSKSQADGRLAVRVNSVTVNGRMYPVSAEVTGLHHQLRGRGVTAGEVEKVGAGTAIGAVLGRVLGGNSKGAIIGGAVGAAGGTAVAVQTASRDVVVPAGAPVTIRLTGALVV